MTDMILVYITCDTVDQAKEIGKHLMNKRLCACVNIFPDMQPMFFWPPKSGKIDESKEVVLIAKTIEGKYEDEEGNVSLKTDLERMEWRNGVWLFDLRVAN